MKGDYFTIEGKKTKTVELPNHFDEQYHPSLIKRAVLAIQSHKRQPYGASPKAGQRASAKLSKRRRKFGTSYGYGISRVPRKKIWRRGSRFGWIGAFAPGTVGGRKAHPPTAKKIFEQKINNKERKKAIRSALGATTKEDLIKARGHIFKELPNVIDSKVENLKKTKDLMDFLRKIGLEKELERVSVKVVRAGKGKSRGRKYKTKKGPLIVVSKHCPLKNAARNILGLDISIVNKLNAELLAPGAVAGRLTLFTKAALDILEKNKLFMDKK